MEEDLISRFLNYGGMFNDLLASYLSYDDCVSLKCLNSEIYENPNLQMEMNRKLESDEEKKKCMHLLVYSHWDVKRLPCQHEDLCIQCVRHKPEGIRLVELPSETVQMLAVRMNPFNLSFIHNPTSNVVAYCVITQPRSVMFHRKSIPMSILKCVVSIDPNNYSFLSNLMTREEKIDIQWYLLNYIFRGAYVIKDPHSHIFIQAVLKKYPNYLIYVDPPNQIGFEDCCIAYEHSRRLDYIPQQFRMYIEKQYSK